MSEKLPPKELTSDQDREMARAARDHDWEFMERVAAHNPLWWCWWDKAGRYRNNRPDDVYVTCLITGMEMLDRTRRHPDWWEIGEWDDARYAAPVRLTDAGRKALTERHLYDMEPVYGGMVEPGWVAIPAPKGEVA